MIIGILFWLLTLLCCSYAFVFGGRDGRWGAFLLMAATLLTIPALLLGNAWRHTELAILAVDIALLVGLYSLMLFSRRYWPIWMTGFHLVAVVSHLSTMLAPSFTPEIYRALASVWSIPLTLSLLLGVELDRRAERVPVRSF
jgi:hypothetical protein